MDITVTAAAGTFADLCKVSTTVTAGEVGNDKDKLLPEELDALQTRMSDALQEIKGKIYDEIERYRPAALARKERLMHEEAAAPKS